MSEELKLFIDTVLKSPDIKILRSIYKMSNCDINILIECIKTTVEQMRSDVESLNLTVEDVTAALILHINDIIENDK